MVETRSSFCQQSCLLETTQRARKSGNPFQTICGVNGEGVTQSHFCYAVLPDSDNVVWVRELTCPECATCGDPDYRKTFPSSSNVGCLNSSSIGSWRKYLILENGQKDPRKEGKGGNFVGKKMFVTHRWIDSLFYQVAFSFFNMNYDYSKTSTKKYLL